MKLNASVLSTLLLAIAAIACILAGITEGSMVLVFAGIIFFLAILILRARQTRKLNEEIKELEREIENEVSDLNNE